MTAPAARRTSGCGSHGYVVIRTAHLVTGSCYVGLVAAHRRDRLAPPVEVSHVAVAGDLRP